MGVKDIVKHLSHGQREMLVDHVAAPVPIVLTPYSPENRNTAQKTRTVLFDQGLVAYRPAGATRPTHSVLTLLGREVVCGVLAEYIEALVATGVVDETTAATLVPKPDALARRLEAALTVP